MANLYQDGISNGNLQINYDIINYSELVATVTIAHPGGFVPTLG